MHLPKQSIRLQSLDVFRGITISLMLFVNAMSLSPSIHPWLAHSHWNGCILADWVFPFFCGLRVFLCPSRYPSNPKIINLREPCIGDCCDAG